MPLTSRQYAEKKGEQCPNCTSMRVQVLGPNSNDGYMGLRCECTACGSSWVEYFILGGYEELSVGNLDDRDPI